MRLPHLREVTLPTVFLAFFALWLHRPASAQPYQVPAAPHYDVVALRVEFQPDTTRFTTGDGTFGGELFPDGLQPSIDPLPHDTAYFQAHLDFLEHYVATVSDGQTTVTTHLVPEVIRLDQPMAAYSPTGFEADSDPEQAKLAALVRDAWATASEQSTFDLSGFDPGRTAFILFHAGVGRDIELLGTTLDKTPQDLPSLFMNQETLSRLGVEGLTFNGFPVRHTMILPRTETRPGVNFIEDESFLLELSINGLLAASFFNYLHVPDLFNTETGESAIGPFGLMDPLGIFAYNGLFPPEPSAWTKLYLGWGTPVTVQGTEPETITLDAAALPDGSDMARVPLSTAEYFLLENRNRDPQGDGLVVRVWKDGALTEQRVQNGEEGFTSTDVSGFIGGVVVGVDAYDWALPGGVDEDGNELNGGMLIWHVDERRIDDETYNTDPEHRLLDLEEADSAQDLGFPSGNPFGVDASQGSPFDFWYLDNPITVITASGQQVQFYENRFGPDTLPSSETNEGGPSFIVLDAFSAPGATMTVTYQRVAEEGVTLRFDEPSLTFDPKRIADGAYLASVPGPADVVLAYSGNRSSTHALSLLDAQTGRGIIQYDEEQPAQAAALGEGRVGYVTESRFSILDTSTPDQRSTFDLPETLEYHSPLVTLPAFEGPRAFVLGEREAGDPVLFEIDPDQPSVLVQDDVQAQVLATDGSQPVLVGAAEARTLGGTTRWTLGLSESVRLGQPAFGRDASGLVGVVPIAEAGHLLFLRADGQVQSIDLDVYTDVLPGGGPVNPWPVLADLDDDGRLDALTTYGEYLVAFTQGGALVSGFPIRLDAAVVAQPLVAELSDSGGWSVVVAATNGYVYAYDLGRQGRLVAGFPLAVGSRVEATPLLHGQTLYAASIEGTVKAWDLSSLGAVWWGQLYGTPQHTSYVELDAEAEPQPSPASASLIVGPETYNWPNPVRDGQTFLRCMTTEDARVRITILDTAGRQVDDIELDVRGGTPAEHLWQTGAQSGAYLARITATSTSGRTDTKLVKIAVVR